MFYKCLKCTVQRPSLFPPWWSLSFCSLWGHQACISACGERACSLSLSHSCAHGIGGLRGGTQVSSPQRHLTDHAPTLQGFYVLNLLPRFTDCQPPPWRIFFHGTSSELFCDRKTQRALGELKLSTRGNTFSAASVRREEMNARPFLSGRFV